jgi:putative thioredoxin
LLERLADDHAGKFVLAKVNIDENPGLAAAFRIQSIPMVVGLRDGAVVDQFIGALPESGVRDFLARLLPSPGEELAHDIGMSQGVDGDFARVLASRLGRAPEQAGVIGLFPRLPAGLTSSGTRALDRIDRDRAAKRRTARRRAAHPPIRRRRRSRVRARVEANPEDLDARFTLAQSLAAGGKHGEALEQYLGVVQRDRHFRDDGARKAMLDIFDLLGPGNELADRYRSELAKVLFR